MTATLAPTAATLTTREFADALFTASLVCGCMPPESLVMDTVRATIRAHGVMFCATTVAGEFGERPEMAVRRMKRARDLVAGLPCITITLKQATRPE